MKTLECAYKRRKLEIRALVSHFSFYKGEKERKGEGAESLGFGRNQFRHIKSWLKVTNFGIIIPKSFCRYSPVYRTGFGKKLVELFEVS